MNDIKMKLMNHASSRQPLPKPKNWFLAKSRQWRRWSGLFAGLFVLVAATSGIILNYKQPVLTALGLLGEGMKEARIAAPPMDFAKCCDHLRGSADRYDFTILLRRRSVSTAICLDSSTSPASKIGSNRSPFRQSLFSQCQPALCSSAAKQTKLSRLRFSGLERINANSLCFDSIAAACCSVETLSNSFIWKAWHLLE